MPICDWCKKEVDEVLPVYIDGRLYEVCYDCWWRYATQEDREDVNEELEKKYMVGKYANMDILEWLDIQDKVVEKIENKSRKLESDKSV